MLKEEFLSPLGPTQVEAARELGISGTRLNELVLGKRGVTADTALHFAWSAAFWPAWSATDGTSHALRVV